MLNPIQLSVDVTAVFDCQSAITDVCIVCLLSRSVVKSSFLRWFHWP